MNPSKDSERIFPASKRINIGTTSSLVDLKAELFRRKAEAVSKVSDVKTVASSSKNEKWKTQAEKLEAQGKLREIKPQRKLKQEETEDVSKLDEDLIRSREALERKTKIYEDRFNRALHEVSRNSSESEDDEHSELVNFKDKVIMERRTRNLNPQRSSPAQEYEDDDGDWVEFTDSLGRTRRCLRKDLDHYKTLDEEASKSRFQNDEESANQETGKNTVEANYQSFVREQANEDSDGSNEPMIGPVHYRDVQKDEVREHGVGFFAFSSDDAERKKQRDLLDALRDQTKKSRVEAVRLKQKRKQQKRDRLRKIAERKGVPFNESDIKSSDSEDDFSQSKPHSVFDSISVRDREVDRLKHIMTREWDVGKEDDSGRTVREPVEPVKASTPSSHKNFIKNQRDERKQEFAPPTSYYDKNGTTIKDVEVSAPKGFNSRPSTKKFKSSQGPETCTRNEGDFNKIIEEKLKQFKYNS